MDEVLSSHSDVTTNRYIRVMTITCLMLLLDLTSFVVLVVLLTITLIEGQESDANQPYRSWANVHDGSLKYIIQTPAQEWGYDKWQVFTIKWSEWIYVLHAIVFFSTFGTTPEAMRRYRSATLYILERIGLKKQQQPSKAVSDIMFSSNPQAPRRLDQRIRRGSLSFLSSLYTSSRHFTVSVRSVVLTEEENEARELKPVTETPEQLESGGFDTDKDGSLRVLSSVSVTIPEEM